MAKYRNREVEIIEELPRGDGDLVKIFHKELGLGEEIVPRNQIIVSEQEMKEIQKQRTPDSNEFQVSLKETKPTGEHTIKGKSK